jgi:hypothetical protein
VPHIGRAFIVHDAVTVTAVSFVPWRKPETMLLPVGGIIALATGHPGSGQAGLALAGISAVLVFAGWLRSGRQRLHERDKREAQVRCPSLIPA